MSMRWILLIALVALVALVLGCGKDEAGKPGAPEASSRNGVIEAWKKGGLTPSPLTAATVAFGKDCQSGTVNGVDVLVCQYPSDAEAKAAEDQALAWVGDTTGIARAAGKVLVAAADRRKADPSGRTLNQLTKLLTPK
jgi:hypothetical protein